MSKFSLCILDDKIPVAQLTDITVDDTSYIDNNILFHCLSLGDEEWGDSNLRNFVNAIKDETEYTISGFTNHSFFFNYSENILFSPDIIVFDWDMGDGGTDSSDNLLKVLSSTYCLVAIFTAEDSEEGVSKELGKKKYQEYTNRCFIVKKEDNDSANKLKTEIDSRKEIFSFKKGRDIKMKTISAINSVLSGIGKLSFDEYVYVFGNDISSGGREISSVAFIELIAEKIKNELVSNSGDNLITKRTEKVEDENLLRKLWNYRLYNSPKDDFVRNGDIIKNKKDKRYFFVYSSDCHLDKLWHKNLGYLVLIPLYKLEPKLKDKLKLNGFKNFSISSLTNPSLDCMTILPGLTVDQKGNYEDYFLALREITAIKISKKEKLNPKSPLLYQHLSNFSSEERFHVSDGFLTSLMQFISENITGYGAVDFTKELSKSISKRIGDIIA